MNSWGGMSKGAAYDREFMGWEESLRSNVIYNIFL